MKPKYYFFAFLFLLSLFSCQPEKKHLKLLKVTEYSSSKVNDLALIKLLEEENNVDIEIHYTLSEDEAIQRLEDKDVDLVIIPNNARSDELNIRTLVPLLPRVFMVLTNKKVPGKSFKEIMETGKVYFEDRSRLDTLIFNKLYYNFDIDENKINSKLSEDMRFKPTDSLEVYAGLTHLNNPLVLRLAGLGWHFFSLGDVNNYKRGSRIEGFTMLNSSGYPFILPMSIFKGKPEASVLTFAINDILICREDLEEPLAFGITKTLIENKSKLIERNPVYNLLNFDYDSQVLTFPKHRGTQKYLNRDEPPVWFNYVKMVWPLISISVVIFGIFASLRQRLRRRKKQNIEMYYNNLLMIRDKLDTAKNVDDYIKASRELKVLRAEAMKSLANKKLDPGESFNIFLALYNEIRNDIGENIRDMREAAQHAEDAKKG